MQDWLEAGAREAWVVDPADRTASVHRSAAPVLVHAETDVLTSVDLLPGFRVALAKIFA